MAGKSNREVASMNKMPEQLRQGGTRHSIASEHWLAKLHCNIALYMLGAKERLCTDNVSCLLCVICIIQKKTGLVRGRFSLTGRYYLSIIQIA